MEHQYENRIVAFLDILGFYNIIQGTTSSTPKFTLDQIISILNLPEPATERHRIFGHTDSIIDLRTTQFSDSIVISVGQDTESLMYLVHYVNRICFYMLQHWILCRGGIATGKVYHHDNIVVGPALIEAYLLESVKAIHPRIILSHDTVDLIHKIYRNNSEFLQFYDGYYMVNILTLFQIFLSKRKDNDYYVDMYFKIRHWLDFEVDNPSNSSQVKEKTEWFRDYFNNTLIIKVPKIIKVTANITYLSS